MRKFLSASSVKQDEPRPPGCMHGMCQSFANFAQKCLHPPSGRPNLLQNEGKSQPELLEISILANLFSEQGHAVTACRSCTKPNTSALKICNCTKTDQGRFA
jgi:hypothetical protein